MIAHELYKRGRALSKGHATLSGDALATIGSGKVVAPLWGDVVMDAANHKLKLLAGTFFGVKLYVVPSNDNFCPAWMCKAI